MQKKFIRFSTTFSTVDLVGNWGNPKAGANGSDFGTIYLNILTGSQGAEPGDGRQLKCDSYNNSFFSGAPLDADSDDYYVLKYSTDTAFEVVTSDAGATEVAEGESLGKGAWYDYDPNVPGNPVLTANFVFYVTVDSVTYAFKVACVKTEGENDHNRGTYTFDVKQL